MRPSSFAVGTMRRTRMAQVAAAFWMRDARTIDVICFRSVSEYVFGILSVAAAEGAEVYPK
jgi:sarcosine oxidase subunit gamma